MEGQEDFENSYQDKKKPGKNRESSTAGNEQSIKMAFVGEQEESVNDENLEGDKKNHQSTDLQREDDVSFTVRKRGKGRPSGSKKRMHSQGDSTNNRNYEIEDGTVQRPLSVGKTPEGRGRGRPPGSTKKRTKSQGDKSINENSFVEDGSEDKKDANETPRSKIRKIDAHKSSVGEADHEEKQSIDIMESEGKKSKVRIRKFSDRAKEVYTEDENIDEKINRDSTELQTGDTVQKRGKGRPSGSKNKRMNSLGDITMNPNTSIVEDDSEAITIRIPLREDNALLADQRRGRGRPPGSKNRTKSQGDKPVVEKHSKVNKADNSNLIKRSKDKAPQSKSFIKLSFKKKGTRKSVSDTDNERSYKLNKVADQESLSDVDGTSKLSTKGVSNKGSPENINSAENLQTDGEGEISNLDIIESQSLKESQKRSRGRPKKITSSQNTVESDAQIPIPKRRAGRPAGVKNKEKIAKSNNAKRPIENFDNSQDLTQIDANKSKNGVVRKTKLKGRVRIDTGKANIGINQLHIRKIPRERAEESLAVLKNPKHPIWEEMNTSCRTSIQRYWEVPRIHMCQQRLRLKYARQFMIRRDWVNLSKVLSIASHDAIGNIKNTRMYQPLLVKYGAICLAHADREQFKKFMQLLLDLDDGSNVLKKCTQLGGIRIDEE